MPSQSRTPPRTTAPVTPAIAPPAGDADRGNAFAQDQLRRADGGGPPADPAAPPADHWSDATSGAPGPLPYLDEMEAAFGQDFGSVRAYLGVEGPLARLGAGAAAVGEVVAFSEKDPSRETVAHELAHVVQARTGGAAGDAPGGVSSPAGGAEREAASAADAVTSGQTPVVTQAIGSVLHREGPDGGVELPAGLPPTPLEECQRLARARDAGCVGAFDALTPADKHSLAENAADISAICGFAPDRTRELLQAAAPSVAIWLRTADAHVHDEQTLGDILADAGAATVDGFVTNAAAIRSLPGFLRANVLFRVTGSATGDESVRLLTDGNAFAVLRAGFQSESAGEALSHVFDATSAQVLGAYTGNDDVGRWFTNDSVRLGQAIIGWGAGEVASWMRALAPKEHGRALLVAAIGHDGASWAGAMATFLNPPTDADAVWLRGTGPANELGNVAIRALIQVNAPLAARVCGWAQWALSRFVLTGLTAGVGPTLPLVQAFLSARPALDAAFEFECALDPIVSLNCLSIGYPTDVFPLLVTDPARLATSYGSPATILFANWLDADQAKHGALMDQLGNHAAWALAFQGIGRLFRLVWFAGQAGKGATWKAAVDANAGLYDAIVADGAVNGTDPVHFRGIGALFGDGTGRTGAQAEATFHKLCPACVVEPPGERTSPAGWAWGVAGSATPSGAAAAVTFEWAMRLNIQVVAPQPTTWIEMVKRTAMQGPAQVSGVRRLIFADHANRYWMVTRYQVPGSPIANGSRTWRPFADPAVLITSSIAYSDSGTILQRTVAHDAAGTNLAPGGQLDASRTTAASQPGDTAGWMDDSDPGTRAGLGRDVGAGTTNQVPGPHHTTTNTPLTYFQNHAVHEFGHQVGARSYQKDGGGTLELGNAMAQRVAGWAQTGNASALSTKLWSGSGTHHVTFTDGNANIAAADAAGWLVAVVSTANEPSSGAGSAVTGASTDGIADKLTALGRVWGHQKLFDYVNGLASIWAIPGIPDMAYEFGTHTPTDGTNVFIWSTRNPWIGSTAQYRKDFFDANKQKLGWYAFSSVNEMFAEMYTKRYTVGATGIADVDRWFDDLEHSPGIVPGSFTPAAFDQPTDATMQGLLGQTTAAPGTAPPVTEVEPPASVVPSYISSL